MAVPRRRFLKYAGASFLFGISGCSNPFDKGLESVELQAKEAQQVKKTSGNINWEESKVKITGSITLPTPCYKVVVKKKEYDIDSGELLLVIGTKQVDTICVDVIQRQKYQLVADFSSVDYLPKKATIIENGVESTKNSIKFG